MSTLKTKRSWTKRPRSQFPEVISPLPTDVSTCSSTETLDSVKAKETALKDEALIKSTNALVCKVDELISQNVSLSDSRMETMRRKVESAMPRLYELAEESSSSHSLCQSSSHTYILMRSAEAFLKKFPDAMQSGVLRPHNSPPPRKDQPAPTGAEVSPNSSAPSPSTCSPPRVSLAQAAIPPPQRLQPHVQAAAVIPRVSQPISSNLFPSDHVWQQAIPNTMHPSPATPSPSALVQPGSYPDTRRQNLPGTSRPPLWSRNYEAIYTPSHLYDAVEQTTQHQKMVLCAVHDLLQTRSSLLTRQPWYEPPIGLSPEELVSGREPHNDPRFRHPALGAQVQRYFRPTHAPPSPAGHPHHFYGNRSVAVGSCLPKSASME